jgi:hypothetical protein
LRTARRLTPSIPAASLVSTQSKPGTLPPFSLLGTCARLSPRGRARRPRVPEPYGAPLQQNPFPAHYRGEQAPPAVKARTLRRGRGGNASKYVRAAPAMLCDGARRPALEPRSRATTTGLRRAARRGVCALPHTRRRLASQNAPGRADAGRRPQPPQTKPPPTAWTPGKSRVSGGRFGDARGLVAEGRLGRREG